MRDCAVPSQRATPNYFRELTPQELLSILNEHSKWLESEDFKLWIRLTRDEKRIKRGNGQADLEQCSLNGSTVQMLNLQGAYMRAVYLHGIFPVKTNFQDAILDEAQLEKAKLSNVQLQGASLKQASIQNVDLQQAMLQGADLQQAILTEVNLNSANLQFANMRGTQLLEVNIHSCDFRDVTGLLPRQLAGTDLTDTKLPLDVASFNGIKRLEELASHAKPLFSSMIFGCVYVWLTIATTTDLNLVINSTTTPLPIIQTLVPIAGFYWAAPPILAAIYVWFHLYLQEMWEELAGMPAVFQNGNSIGETVYPWLLTSFGGWRAGRKYKVYPALFRVTTILIVFLAWWIVPFTLILLWLRYLPRHEVFGTSLHVLFIGASITVAIFLQLLGAGTLRSGRGPYPKRATSNQFRIYEGAALIVGIFGLCCVLLGKVSMWAIEGTQPPSASTRMNMFLTSVRVANRSPSQEWYHGEVFIPRLFARVGYRSAVNLEETDISAKPEGWTGQYANWEETVLHVKGADLRGMNLRGAILTRSFLINAKLAGTNLQEADLREAQLQGADLTGAQLQNANLEGAHMEGANLSGANLQAANLVTARLKNARFSKPRGPESPVQYLPENERIDWLDESDAVNLKNADLTLADLRGVVGLTQKVLDEGCGLGVFLSKPLESPTICIFPLKPVQRPKRDEPNVP